MEARGVPMLFRHCSRPRHRRADIEPVVAPRPGHLALVLAAGVAGNVTAFYNS